MKNKLLILTACLFVYTLTSAQTLTKNQIVEITTQIENLIGSNYVIKEKRPEIVELFNRNVKNGKYFSIINPDSLASALSTDLKEISNDGHLYVKHLKNPANTNEIYNWEKEELDREIRFNYGFREVQILDSNIGYINIVEFMHPKRSMQTAIAAMKLVENTSSLIIDLRGNRGGYPGIMEYLLNHYFEGEPTLLSTTYFSDPKMNPITTYSSDLIYGKLRIGTPLYILIDKKTASAAEYFAYTLQAHKKAIIVGEGSSGATNMNTFFTLPNNFRISISTEMPIIEITKTNWEGIGVLPDFVVTSEDAKRTAIGLINNSK